ncbi:MAG: hypothetical protein DU429_07500 [Candidatus Tokpelaia sp.]|nr:MAG: hypothetical protein DU430_08900 [Candidatus Tokpelaia sp.]KAA6205755.1 MAG: hypothetical protein DU429_07500 [Candidatus Tokpelaia sp.]
MARFRFIPAISPLEIEAGNLEEAKIKFNEIQKSSSSGLRAEDDGYSKTELSVYAENDDETEFYAG